MLPLGSPIKDLEGMGCMPVALAWADLVLLCLLAQGAGRLAATAIAHPPDAVIEVGIPPPQGGLCDVAIQTPLFNLHAWAALDSGLRHKEDY